MLDAAPGLFARPAPPLPVAALVVGKRREEVAALLPRLFSLCRAAQARAVRLALDLPGAEDDESLRREILRDHVLRLSVVLPGHFGQSPAELPHGWQAGGEALRRALFGPAGAVPRDLHAYRAWRDAGAGPVAALARRVEALFRPGEACGAPLPLVCDATALDRRAAVENSPAARVAGHPLLAALEAEGGRNPLWRVLARACDLDALLAGAPLGVRRPAAGTALVPATRGLYAVRAAAEDETVTAFERVTPTDHLLAPGGVLERALATLPADRAGLAPLLVDILDPCSPIRLEEPAHA